MPAVALARSRGLVPYPHKNPPTPRATPTVPATHTHRPTRGAGPAQALLPACAGARPGRRPRARVLAGGLRLVTEGYIRSPPLPPTLLLDRGDRPRVDLRPNPVDRFICILRRMFKKCSKTSFFTVFRGLRPTRLSSNRAPVVSVMRAARTGLIDISWVLGT